VHNFREGEKFCGIMKRYKEYIA